MSVGEGRSPDCPVPSPTLVLGDVDPERQLLQPPDPPRSGGGEGHPGLGKASRPVEAVPAREPLPISPSTTETDRCPWRLGKGVPVLFIKTPPVIRGRSPNQTWTDGVSKRSLGVQRTLQARETPLTSGQLPLLLCTRSASLWREHPASASLLGILALNHKTQDKGSVPAWVAPRLGVQACARVASRATWMRRAERPLVAGSFVGERESVGRRSSQT